MEEYNVVFTAVVNSFTDGLELGRFADLYGLWNDPQVQARLSVLLDWDVSNMVSEIDEMMDETLDVVVTNNETEPPHQRVKSLESVIKMQRRRGNKFTIPSAISSVLYFEKKFENLQKEFGNANIWQRPI